MPSEKDFSFISVSSDEEDDIVIQAGAVSASASEVGVEAGEADDYEDFGDYEDEVVEAGAAAEEAEAAGAAAAEAAEEAPAPRNAQAANGMLTSEEDLNAPMPYAGMQRAIMIGFVLLLVAAVAYWFFIRPISG